MILEQEKLREERKNMIDNYPKAYKEVYEILKNIPKEDLEKIPENVFKTIEEKKDDNYNFEFSGDIDNQDLLKETRALLATIYKNYWANMEEREVIEAKILIDIKKAINSEES